MRCGMPRVCPQSGLIVRNAFIDETVGFANAPHVEVGDPIPGIQLEGGLQVLF
jgi:hypothetical protein